MFVKSCVHPLSAMFSTVSNAVSFVLQSSAETRGDCSIPEVIYLRGCAGKNRPI